MKTRIALLFLCLAVGPALAAVAVQPAIPGEETATLAMVASIVGVSLLLAVLLFLLVGAAFFLPVFTLYSLGLAGSIVGVAIGSSKLKKHSQTLSRTVVRKFRAAKILGWIGVGLSLAWAAFLLLMIYVLIFVLGVG